MLFRSFPEIANFYHAEVIQPGIALIRRILQRGIDGGEFRPIDLDQAVHTVYAPMIFLMMWKNSMGLCTAATQIHPERFIDMQVDVLLHGMTI